MHRECHQLCVCKYEASNRFLIKQINNLFLDLSKNR